MANAPTNTQIAAFLRVADTRPKRGFTMAEAAHYLGISEWTIQKEVRESRLVAKKRGSTVLFDKDELDRYFDALPEI